MPVRESERIRENVCGACTTRQSSRRLRLWSRPGEDSLRICEACWDGMNSGACWSSLPPAAKAAVSMPEVSILQKPRRTRKTAEERASEAATRALAIGGSPDTAMRIDSSDEEDCIMESAAASLHGVMVAGQTPGQSSCTRQPVVREGLRDTTLRRLQQKRFAYPSRLDGEQVEVHGDDLRHLAPFEFLNDTIIDFYIKYMQRPETLDERKRSTVHFCNSFFFKKLLSIFEKRRKSGVDQTAALPKLRKWTKGTNIFEKSYVFVPIHDRLHWSLAIICFPGAGGDMDDANESEACILHLDSLSRGHYSPKVFQILRSYLAAEWDSKWQQEQTDVCTVEQQDGNQMTVAKLPSFNIKVKRVMVPQQENEFDCGCFLLYYMRSFVQTAPATFRLEDIDKKGLFGRCWFTANNASNLRGEIRKLVEKLLESGEDTPLPCVPPFYTAGRKRRLTDDVDVSERGSSCKAVALDEQGPDGDQESDRQPTACGEDLSGLRGGGSGRALEGLLCMGEDGSDLWGEETDPDSGRTQQKRDARLWAVTGPPPLEPALEDSSERGLTDSQDCDLRKESLDGEAGSDAAVHSKETGRLASGGSAEELGALSLRTIPELIRDSPAEEVQEHSKMPDAKRLKPLQAHEAAAQDSSPALPTVSAKAAVTEVFPKCGGAPETGACVKTDTAPEHALDQSTAVGESSVGFQSGNGVDSGVILEGDVSRSALSVEEGQAVPLVDGIVKDHDKEEPLSTDGEAAHGSVVKQEQGLPGSSANARRSETAGRLAGPATSSDLKPEVAETAGSDDGSMRVVDPFTGTQAAGSLPNHELSGQNSEGVVAGVGDGESKPKQEARGGGDVEHPLGHLEASKVGNGTCSQPSLKRRREGSGYSNGRPPASSLHEVMETKVEAATDKSSIPRLKGLGHWWALSGGIAQQEKVEEGIERAVGTGLEPDNGVGLDDWLKVDSDRWAQKVVEAKVQTRKGQEVRGFDATGETEEALSEEMGSLYGGGMQGNNSNGLQSLDDELGDDKGWWEDAIGVEKDGGKLEADAAESNQREVTENGEVYAVVGQDSHFSPVEGHMSDATGDVVRVHRDQSLSAAGSNQRVADNNGMVPWTNDLESWNAGEQLVGEPLDTVAGPDVPPVGNGGQTGAGPSTSFASQSQADQSLQAAVGMQSSGSENGETGHESVCGGPAAWEGYPQRPGNSGLAGWWQNQSTEAPKWFTSGSSASSSGEQLGAQQPEALGTFVPVTAALPGWVVPLGPQDELQLDSWADAEGSRALKHGHADLPGLNPDTPASDHFPRGNPLPAVAEEEPYFVGDPTEKDELKLVMEILEGEEEALGLAATPIGCGMGGWDELDCEDPYLGDEEGALAGSLTNGNLDRWAGGAHGSSGQSLQQGNFGRGVAGQSGRIHVTPFATPVVRSGSQRHSASPGPEAVGADRVRRFGKRSLSRARSAGAKLSSPRGERRVPSLNRARSESTKEVTPTRRSHRLSIKRSGGMLAASSVGPEQPTVHGGKTQFGSISGPRSIQRVPSGGMRQAVRSVHLRLSVPAEVAAGGDAEQASQETVQQLGGTDGAIAGERKAAVLAEGMPVSSPDREGRDGGAFGEDAKIASLAVRHVGKAPVASTNGLQVSDEHQGAGKSALDGRTLSGGGVGKTAAGEKPVLASEREEIVKEQGTSSREAFGNEHVECVHTAVQATKEEDGEDPWSLDLEESARTRGISAWEGARRVWLTRSTASGADAEKAQKAAPLPGESRPRGPAFAPGWGGRLPSKKPIPVREPTPEPRDTGVTVTFVYPSREASESEAEGEAGANGDSGDRQSNQTETSFSSDVLDQCVSLAALDMVGVGESGGESRRKKLDARVHCEVESGPHAEQGDLQDSGILERKLSLRAGKSRDAQDSHHLKDTLDSSPVLAVKQSSRNRRPPRRLVEDGLDSTGYQPAGGQRKWVTEEQLAAEVNGVAEVGSATTLGAWQDAVASERGQASHLSRASSLAPEEGKDGMRELMKDRDGDQPVMRVYERRSLSKALEPRATGHGEDATSVEQAGPAAPSDAGGASGPNAAPAVEPKKEAALPLPFPASDSSGRAPQSKRGSLVAGPAGGSLDDSPAMTARSGARERKRPQRFSDDELEGWWFTAVMANDRKVAGIRSHEDRRQAGKAAETGSKLRSDASALPVASNQSAVQSSTIACSDDQLGGTQQALHLDSVGVVVALPAVLEKPVHELRLDSLKDATTDQLSPELEPKQGNVKKPRREARRGGSSSGPDVEGALGMLHADLGQSVREAGEMLSSERTSLVKQGGAGLRVRKLRTLEDIRQP